MAKKEFKNHSEEFLQTQLDGIITNKCKNATKKLKEMQKLVPQ